MRRTICLVALAGIAVLGLFGCGGHSTSSGFAGMEVSITGRYDVMSKDPAVLPGFYSLQVTQTGKSLQGIDNLGRTWTGKIGDFTKFGVYAIGAEDTQQQQQQPGQQPQPEVPESFHAEMYLSAQTKSGTVTITGTYDSRLTLTTQQGQQQETTREYAIIMGTVVDERGNAGAIMLVNPVGYYTQTTDQG